MQGNKYETSVARKIIDNIEYMLENTSTVENELIKDYYVEEVRVMNRYRNTILPKLKNLIEKSRILEKKMQDQNQGEQMASLKQRIDLYQCVIKQMNPSYPLEAKQRMLDYYNSNRHRILDQNIRLCLDQIISANNILNDYRQSKQEVSFIWQQFKNFISLSDQYSLASNIQLIRGYLMRTQVENTSKLAPFDQITSASLILNQCIQKLKQGTPLGNYYHILNNIKIQALSQPLACLAELIAQDNSQQQVKGEEKEQFHPCMDQVQYYQVLPYLQILPGIAQSILKITDPDSTFDCKNLNPAFFTKLVDKLFGKLNKAAQFQAKYHKSQQHLSNFTLEIAMANQQLVYRQKLISQLRTEVDNLNKQLELQRQFTVSLNGKIAEDANLIEKLRNDIALLEKEAKEIKEAAMTKQNNQDLRQQQELKQRFLQLSKQKNELHTQVYSLTHQLQDERIAHQTHLKQQIQKVIKIMQAQKMKEIEKVEERRRVEKSKISKEAQELFDELQQLKDKYYTEIGNKLMRSRMDQSICRSDKGVGDSFMVENDVLEGLEDEGNENSPYKNEDSPNRSINELQNEFKKQFQEEILRLNTKNTQLQAQIQLRQDEIKELHNELQKQIHQKQRVMKQLQTKTQDLLRLNEQKTISNNKIKELIAANKMYQTALKKSSGINQQSSTSCRPRFISYQKTLLQGQIFDQNQHQKLILLKHITAYTRLQLIKTKMLYQYYPNNKTNFHSFIDNKKGLLCVVKTSNTIIAGFYPGSLIDGTTMNEGGLLVSVRNDRSYALMEKKNDNSKINYRGMTYDPYYVVFGNAEMRIRTGQNRVFSNFGIQNGYFNYENSSRSVNEFLGEGDNREIEFQLCQFYQLFFEGQAITSNNHTNPK